MKLKEFVFLLIIPFSVNGQWLTTGTPNTSTLYTNGNVGIGTATPSFKLHLATSNNLDGLSLKHNNGAWVNFFSPSMTGGAFNGVTQPGDAGIIFGNIAGLNSVSNGFVIAPHRSTASGLRINNNGDVGIGTNSPTSNLDVRGILRVINISPTNTYTFLGQNATGDASTYSYFYHRITSNFHIIGSNGATGAIKKLGLAVGGGDIDSDVKMTIDQNGNVGIGTISPEEKLEVNGGISLAHWGRVSSKKDPANNYTNLFLGGAIVDQGNGSYKILGDGGSNHFAGIKMDNYGGNSGAIKFYSRPTTGGNDYQLTNSELENYVRMTIVNGNVGIGTNNPDAKLAVKGTIHTQEVKVDMQGSMVPDYVFEPSYKLPTLDSVYSYINQNKHLPEVPSAKEMEANGVNLGEMNMLLLKKVEELTLYLFELKMENKILKERMVKVEEKIAH